jgi:hypothetical protein
MSNTNNLKTSEQVKLIELISNLSEIKGQTPSSMITLAIHSKYCI